MGLPVARVFVDKDTPHCGDVLLRMATNNVNVFVGGMPAAKFADPNSPHLPPGCIGVEVGAVNSVRNVFAWGDPITTITDPVSCGTIVGIVQYTGVFAGP